MLPKRGERGYSRGTTWRGTGSLHATGKQAGTVRPLYLFKTVFLLTPTVRNLAPGKTPGGWAGESPDLWALNLGKL